MEQSDFPLSFYLFVHPFCFYDYTKHFLFACLTVFISSPLAENKQTLLENSFKSVGTFFRIKQSSFKSTFILLLQVYPQGNEIPGFGIHKNLYTNVSNNFISSTQNWQQPRWPSTGKWSCKRQYIHTMNTQTPKAILMYTTNPKSISRKLCWVKNLITLGLGYKLYDSIHTTIL